MGKYDKIIPTLSPLPIALRDGGTRYQERVDEERATALDRDRAVGALRAWVEQLGIALARYSSAAIPDGPAARHALEYRLLYDVEEAAEELAKATRLRMEARSQLLRELMEIDGLSSMRLADGSLLTDAPEPYATTNDPIDPTRRETNDELLRAWLTEQHMESLLKINFQSLNGIVKERLLRGETPPPGVNVFFRPRLSLTRR